MSINILFNLLIATTTLAAPLSPRSTTQTSAWLPADGTTGVCKPSDKFMSFDVKSQIAIFVDNVCATMMPACAYPSRHVGDDLFCIQTIDWPLSGVKSNTQSADVESTAGVAVDGWDVKFSVTPASQPDGSAGVFWTVQDCNGYFSYLLSGCRGGQQGFGVGRLRIGGDTSLNGTVFETSIVAAQ